MEPFYEVINFLRIRNYDLLCSLLNVLQYDKRYMIIEYCSWNLSVDRGCIGRVDNGLDPEDIYCALNILSFIKSVVDQDGKYQEIYENVEDKWTDGGFNLFYKYFDRLFGLSYSKCGPRCEWGDNGCYVHNNPPQQIYNLLVGDDEIPWIYSTEKKIATLLLSIQKSNCDLPTEVNAIIIRKFMDISYRMN